jgi:hypothetical protein
MSAQYSIVGGYGYDLTERGIFYGLVKKVRKVRAFKRLYKAFLKGKGYDWKYPHPLSLLVRFIFENLSVKGDKASKKFSQMASLLEQTRFEDPIIKVVFGSGINIFLSKTFWMVDSEDFDSLAKKSYLCKDIGEEPEKKERKMLRFLNDDPRWMIVMETSKSV